MRCVNQHEKLDRDRAALLLNSSNVGRRETALQVLTG